MNSAPYQQHAGAQQRPPPPPPGSVPGAQPGQRPPVGMRPPMPQGSPAPGMGVQTAYAAATAWNSAPATNANEAPMPQQQQQQQQQMPQQARVVSPQQQQQQYAPQIQRPPMSMPYQQQQPIAQQPQAMAPGMAGMTQQMGNMNLGQPQQQQQGMQSPPPGSHAHAHAHKARAKRVYAPAASMGAPGAAAGAPPAGYPPMSGAPPQQMPYGAQAQPQPGYPAAPGGQQTFVPGAQAPTPGPAAGSPYARPAPLTGGVAGAPQQAPYEPPRPRIDPNQMPTPSAVHTHDQELHNEQPYSTALKTNVPLASTNFTAIDEGNSNPRFMRMTMYNLLKASHLPLGMIVQPLADLAPSEAPVQLIDFGAEGPIRCIRCKTYINPHMTFIEGGKRFVCNMCRHENEVPEDYFCNLDMAGQRLDREARPELRCGSVEFVATKEFITHNPRPATYIFAIDVTWNAVQSGMVATAAKTIKDLLYQGPGLPAGTRVGIITFDRSAHFYNLLSSLDQAQMMVVPDIRDIFVPLNEGLAVDPIESQLIIEQLLDSLPAMFARNRTAEPVLGAVIQAVHETLSGCGGKLFLHNTDKEKTLYEPQDSFYHEWAVKLVEQGISCNLYLFPAAYIDAATLGQLSTVTSGEMYMYPAFHTDRDGPQFASDLRYDAQRPFGTNGVLRIRTSDGLRVDEHYGNLYMRNHVDVELAGITSDTAIGALLQYDGKLDEKQDVYFQVALLYTTSDGQRRIRVHNLAIPCTTLIGNMFRHSEVDASMNLVAKMAVADAMHTPLKQIRDKLTDRTVQILTAYRRNCASGSSPGQLILPEAYKLPALRGGADVPIDQRVYHMNLLRQFSVPRSMEYFYPRVRTRALARRPVLVTLPPLSRASYTVLDPTGAYLIVNKGSSLYLWLGRQTPASFVQEVLGAPAVEQVDVLAHQLPELDTALNQKIRAIARQLVPLARRGLDQSEVALASLLVEDRNNDNMTYVDFVCAVHRQIQLEIRPKGPLEPKWSYN
ncbi:hypothetical protein DL89DRAFT_276965 [Linderina pennispora]|uniref:Beta-sandwich domain of Sec23/24 n=1 Tax=Linderina pennispora TaxID=61395 RepID=A0A1Y1WJF9_9FUNG|nr:uncharacterized protein DL89DRAFT_276965 [Linderina pennispora]ORX73679.1 hypothetical protein DL89DRAFT_276965 [Linderina pennispora]